MSGALDTKVVLVTRAGRGIGEANALSGAVR
jgi:NAD(P)-dependent dehydrogenase (short-subunit alcohol dehydrogenase family)